jgi:hypothetical protein
LAASISHISGQRSFAFVGLRSTPTHGFDVTSGHSGEVIAQA